MIEWAIAGAVAAIGIAWALIRRGRKQGEDAARLKAADRAAENRETRNDADRDARNDDDPAGSLLDKWSRD